MSALIKVGDVYAWDLDAPEVVYPFLVDYDGHRFQIAVGLAQPYSADALIEAISEGRGGFRRTPETVDVVQGDPELFAKLASKTFVRLYLTSTEDVEEQRKWLDADKQRAFRIRVVREGLGNIFITREDGERTNLDLLPIALDVASDVTVRMHQDLWDVEKRAKVRVHMVHSFQPETEKDWRAWQRSSSEQFQRAKNVGTEVVNWWKRTELYDRMIRKIDGMYCGGQPCLEATKAEWVKKVPAWHKFLAIGEVFEESRVKN